MNRPFGLIGLAAGLALSLAACGAGVPAPGGATGNGGVPGNAQGDPVPSAMQGSWLYGTLSPVEYYDETNDKWLGASGASEIVTYKQGGQYERTRLLSLTTGNCTSKLYIHETGVTHVRGSELTYQPQGGVSKGYACSSGRTYQTRDIKSETWDFELTQNEYGQDVLVLSSGEAVAHCGRYQP